MDSGICAEVVVVESSCEEGVCRLLWRGEILRRVKLGMKADVERREGNEEARLKETNLVIKASGCGEFGYVRVRGYMRTNGSKMPKKEGSKGLRKAVLEEPRAASQEGSEWPFA